MIARAITTRRAALSDRVAARLTTALTTSLAAAAAASSAAATSAARTTALAWAVEVIRIWSPAAIVAARGAGIIRIETRRRGVVLVTRSGRTSVRRPISTPIVAIPARARAAVLLRFVASILNGERIVARRTLGRLTEGLRRHHALVGTFARAVGGYWCRASGRRVIGTAGTRTTHSAATPAAAAAAAPAARLTIRTEFGRTIGTRIAVGTWAAFAVVAGSVASERVLVIWVVADP